MLTGASLALTELFHAADLASLAGLVADRERAEPVASAAIARGAPVASPAQQRLWFLAQLEPDSAAYNECLVLRLAGPLREDLLERALHTIVGRHEVLRMTFSPAGDGASVRISDTAGAVQGCSPRSMSRRRRPTRAPARRSATSASSPAGRST